MTPKVYNKHHRDLVPTSAIYVGRPTKFGNPFKINGYHTRPEVIKQYETYILQHPELLAAAKAELRGKDLVCCCSPLPCHADVLLKYANETVEWEDWAKSLDSQILPKEDNV